jgi:uncharacterized DUF497 family protein
VEKKITWNLGKNTKLKLERGVSFEDVYSKLQRQEYKAKNNPSPKYKRQRMFVIVIKSKIYAVPYTEYGSHIFLRTIYEVKL